MKRELQYGYGTTVDERYDRIYWPLRKRVKLWAVGFLFCVAIVAGAALCAWIDS